MTSKTTETYKAVITDPDGNKMAEINVPKDQVDIAAFTTHQRLTFVLNSLVKAYETQRRG